MKLLCVALALCLLGLPAPVSAESSPAYVVTMPAGYEGGAARYPVIYLLPQDGLHIDDSGLYEQLSFAFSEGLAMPMLIVRPQFEEGADPAAMLAQVIAEVDAQYRTVADRDHRAAVGTGVGGYLAYALALADNSGIGAMASIRGNFGAEGNVWYEKCGSVQEKIEAMHAADQNVFNTYYTYMDAPVDDAWTDIPGGTDALGALMITYGTGSAFHEFTARPGEFSDDFLAASALRIADRLTGRMLTSLVSGSMELNKTVVSPEDEAVTASFKLSIADTLTAYSDGEVPATVTLSLLDGATGECLAKADAELVLPGPGEYEGTLPVENALSGESAEAALSVSVLGATAPLASVKVVRAQGDIIDGDWQELSLSGDWHFNYVGAATQLDATALKPEDFSEWPVVQPGLASWTKGFGNISDENVTSGYGPDYFDFFIIGNGYYAKTFTIPEGFNTQEPVLSVGYVDDRCEVFLNGVRVGATGMDENGNTTGETTWAVFSHFDVDPALLNVGGENIVIVRAFNDLPFGAGGWYGGPTGLYSKTAFDARYAADNDARFYEETFQSAHVAAATGAESPAENKYLIYLPEDYETSNRRYPTVYLLHQFNSDHTSYRTDKINLLLDEGIRAGLFDPMIVVIPNSNEQSWWRGDWEKMITDELIPLIDGKYRTIPDARCRLTAGCSMGGQGAYGVALRNPDYFSGVISFFGAFSYGGENSPNTIAAQESAEYLQYFTHYFICGNQDSYGFGAPAIQLHQQLLEKDVAHRFFIENGGHDSAFYVPFFQDAFTYVRANMYRYDGGADGLFSASLVQQGTSVYGDLTADPAITAYLMKIPASAYTLNTDPALCIPMTAALYDGDECVLLMDGMNGLISEDSLSFTLEADLAEYLTEGKTLTFKVYVSVFDSVIEVASLDVTAQ